MKAFTVLAALSFLSVASAQTTVYLIRHGEKPSSGNGLSTQGEERAQCLRTVFGASSSYDIGYIMAETPQSGRFSLSFQSPHLHYKRSSGLRSVLINCKDGSQQRPYDTVEPLANDLGITVDTSCQRDDQDCVASVVEQYSGTGNILICWEHKALHDIVKALGDQDAPDYDGDQ